MRALLEEYELLEMKMKRKYSQMYKSYKPAAKVHPVAKDNRMWMRPKMASQGSGSMKQYAGQDAQDGDYMPPQEKEARRHYDHAYRMSVGRDQHKKIKAQFDAGMRTTR